MTHLSLFTGIGGIDLAAEMAGFRTVGQVEINDYCNRVLEHHWPDVPRWRDVKDVTAETFTERTGIAGGGLALLSGGFPCQPVSAAGKREGDKDERWLWDEMLRVICEIRPRWVVAENVRGLLSARSLLDGRHLFGRVLRDLAQNGYRAGWLCFGAGDVGAPHKRERVFIVAHATSMERPARAEVKGSLREVQGNWAKYDHSNRSGEARNPDVADPSRQLLNRTGNTGQTGRGEFTDGGEGAAQSRLGDATDGLPAGMVGHRWPKGKWPTPTSGPKGNRSRDLIVSKSSVQRRGSGQKRGIELETATKFWPTGPGEQHPWEPPRIATGVKDRVAKLKALGNAVVPAQAYPIFRAIRETEEAIS